MMKKIRWLLMALLGIFPIEHALSQNVIPDNILDIFDESCAFSGCHAGPKAPRGLDLSEDAAANLINVQSAEVPKFMRVKPGDPQNSYIIKKLIGAPDMRGERMPKGSKPLAKEAIAAIAKWIAALPPETRVAQKKAKNVEAFPGWSLANLPTAETPRKGAFTYRVAHRFKLPVDSGFDKLFGLDGGAFMMTQLFFPVTNDLTFTAGRNAVNATFEFGGKWRFLREKTGGGAPVSAALYAGVDWATLKEIVDPSASGDGELLSRTAGERFGIFAQAAVSKTLGNRLSLLVVPGLLVNGNVNDDDEDALVSLGLAGKINLNETYALFVEAVPILSGDETADVVGGARLEDGNRVYNDAFTAGVEIKAGGHVFHVFVTNSAGNTTGQYMSGGNFDFAGGDFRLGFNIYRILKYPF